MNVIQVEFWQLAGVLVTLVFANITAFWALAKVIARQTTDNINLRFAEVHKHMKRQDDDFKLLERQLNDMRVELPRDYVRREDHVRDIASIKITVENLALNIEKWMRSLLTTKKGNGE